MAETRPNLTLVARSLPSGNLAIGAFRAMLSRLESALTDELRAEFQGLYLQTQIGGLTEVSRSCLSLTPLELCAIAPSLGEMSPHLQNTAPVTTFIFNTYRKRGEGGSYVNQGQFSFPAMLAGSARFGARRLDAAFANESHPQDPSTKPRLLPARYFTLLHATSRNFRGLRPGKAPS